MGDFLSSKADMKIIYKISVTRGLAFLHRCLCQIKLTIRVISFALESLSFGRLILYIALLLKNNRVYLILYYCCTSDCYNDRLYDMVVSDNRSVWMGGLSCEL